MRCVGALILLSALGARADDGLALGAGTDDALAAPDAGELGAAAGSPPADESDPGRAPSDEAVRRTSGRGRACPEPDAGAGPLDGFSFRVSGYAQVDATPYSQASLDELNPSTGQPLNELGVSLRHLHLAVSASRWIFSGAAEADANSALGLGVRLYSAELSARWPTEGPPLAQVRAGLLRIPFGVDAQTEALQRTFFEPLTMSVALFPGGYDLGVELSGEWRFLRYQLAVMNGEPVGERSFPARDPNAPKDLVGRLGVEGAPMERLRVAAGVSGLSGAGFHPGLPATKDTLVWRDANEDGLVQSTELQVVGGLPATPSEGFPRFALDGDLRFAVDVPRLGTLDVAGELIWGKNLDRGLFVADPVSTGRDLRELGWAISVTQQLPFGFTVGARRDVYTPDADAADQQGARRVPYDSSIAAWSAMATWRWRRTARVMAQFDHQTNALGRGLNGAPTTLGADRLLLRAEVSF